MKDALDGDRSSAPTTRVYYPSFAASSDESSFDATTHDSALTEFNLASRILKRNATSIRSIAQRSSRTVSIDGNRQSSAGSFKLRALPSFNQSSRLSLRAEDNFIDKSYVDDEEEDVWNPIANEQALRWLASQSNAIQALGGGTDIKLIKLSGGLCNSVYVAESESTGQVIVIKNCKPFIQEKGEESAVQLEIQRMETEAVGLDLAHRLAPGFVPRLLAHEIMPGGESGFMALEYLKDREMLSVSLARGSIYPGLGEQLGRFTASLIAGTSPAAMGIEAFDKLCDTLDASGSVAELMTAHVLYLPFEADHLGNNWPASTKVDALVRSQVYKSKELMDQVRELRLLRSSPPPDQLVFLHTDIWINNILCHHTRAGQVVNKDDPPSISIIDFEFGTLGPSSYDIGHIIGQLVLSLCLVQAYAEVECSEAEEEGMPLDVSSAAPRQAQIEWLLESIEEAHASLLKTLKETAPEATVPPLEDIFGFAGCTVLRWSLGQFNIFNPYLSPVSVAMADSVYRAVLIGVTLLKERRQMQSMQDLIRVIRTALKETSQ